MILKHARAQIEMKGEFIGIREMRKHVAWYTAGMPHSAGLRRESNNIESYADLERLLERLECLRDADLHGVFHADRRNAALNCQLLLILPEDTTQKRCV